MKFKSLSCALMLATAAVSASSAPSWNLSADYADATNPNGNWTYGSLPGGTFTALDWNAPTTSYGIVAAGQTFIYKNTSGAFAFGIDDGEVSLEADWGNPDVRWTALAAGTYSFLIDVGGSQAAGGGGTGNNFVAQAGVRVNGVDRAQSSFDDNVKSWNFTVALAAGETVDTFVLNPGFAESGNTQTKILVSAVPEPGSAPLLALGLGSVLAVRLRSRR